MRREILVKALGEELFYLTEQQHGALLEVIRASAPLKQIIENHTFLTILNDSWDSLPSLAAL